MSAQAGPHLAQDSDAVAIMCVLWACRREIPLKAETFNSSGLEWIKDHCENRRIWVVKQRSPHLGDDREIAGVMILKPQNELGAIKGEHHEVF